MASPRFKDYSIQRSLFPENLFDRIPKNHPVRLVDKVVENLNIDRLMQKYKGGGTSSRSSCWPQSRII